MSGFAERVGFVGLGRMGRPVARRLLAANVRLAVFDARQDAVERFVSEVGGERAQLPALAEKSDVVITMLPDGKAVREVAAVLMTAMRSGSVLVDMSSSSPTGTRELGRSLARHEAQVLPLAGLRDVAFVAYGVGAGVRRLLVVEMR